MGRIILVFGAFLLIHDSTGYCFFFLFTPSSFLPSQRQARITTILRRVYFDNVFVNPPGGLYHSPLYMDRAAYPRTRRKRRPTFDEVMRINRGYFGIYTVGEATGGDT